MFSQFLGARICALASIPVWKSFWVSHWLVIDHFWQFSEILNLTKTSKWHNFHLYSSLLNITFWFSTLKFSKLQIFSSIWQSILKMLPPSKDLQGPSLTGLKSNLSTICIRLKTCILYTHTKVFQSLLKILENLRWWVTWIGWLDMELPKGCLGWCYYNHLKQANSWVNYTINALWNCCCKNHYNYNCSR